MLRKVTLIVTGIIAAAMVGPLLYYIMPFQPVGRPTVVASATLGCGETLLTQTFTATLDPYIVSFYFRPSGAKLWSEYYVDHQSIFWRGGLRVDPDGGGCALMYYGAEQAHFSCQDRLLAQGKRWLPAKAAVEDPMAKKLGQAQSPMDVGAQSKDLTVK
jgi:hypothetical protein